MVNVLRITNGKEGHWALVTQRGQVADQKSGEVMNIAVDQLDLAGILVQVGGDHKKIPQDVVDGLGTLVNEVLHNINASKGRALRILREILGEVSPVEKSESFPSIVNKFNYILQTVAKMKFVFMRHFDGENEDIVNADAFISSLMNTTHDIFYRIFPVKQDSSLEENNPTKHADLDWDWGKDQERIVDLEDELEKKNRELSMGRAENNKLNYVVGNLTTQLHNKCFAIEQANARLMHEEERCHNYMIEVEELRKDVETLGQMDADNEEKLQEMERIKNGYLADIADLKREIDVLKMDYIESEEKLNATIENQRKALEDIAGKNEEYKAKLKKYVQRIEEARAVAKDFGKRLVDAQQKNEELERRLKGMRSVVPVSEAGVDASPGQAGGSILVGDRYKNVEAKFVELQQQAAKSEAMKERAKTLHIATRPYTKKDKGALEDFRKLVKELMDSGVDIKGIWNSYMKVNGKSKYHTGWGKNTKGLMIGEATLSEDFFLEKFFAAFKASQNNEDLRKDLADLFAELGTHSENIGLYESETLKRVLEGNMTSHSEATPYKETPPPTSKHVDSQHSESPNRALIDEYDEEAEAAATEADLAAERARAAAERATTAGTTSKQKNDNYNDPNWRMSKLETIKHPEKTVKFEEDIKKAVDHIKQPTGYEKYKKFMEHQEKRRKERDDINDHKKIIVMDGFSKYLRFKQKYNIQ